jgi:hypothetical protein
MANTNTVLDMVARESLRLAHEKATFISTVDRSYDDQYKKTGWKTGSVLRVAQPNSYTRRQGSRVMDVQDQNEATQTITMATQDGVDMRFNSAELALNVNSPAEVDAFSKRYIEPAMAVLISGIESDFLAQATKDTYNLVGTAGTVVGASDITALFNARAKLNQYLAPKDNNRSAQIDSVTMASIVNKNTALFHPNSGVEKAFTEGYYGRVAGCDFFENERAYTQACGSDHTTVTVATTHLVADGAATLTIVNGVATVGDVFTVAGVYACHPESKASSGSLQQFVVTGVTGSVALTVSPTIYLGSSASTAAKQNVCTAAGAKCTTATFDSNPVATFVGADSASLRQNLMYHKDAFTFVTADLPLMDDAHKCVRKVQDGLSIRVWMASDIRNDELLMRMDILYGFKTLRPEWACRITN